LKRGFFIVFEGPDGSGKSTQAEVLYHKLLKDGFSCEITHEPGGTTIGKRISKLLLDPELTIFPKTELFLFLADRSEHVKTVIQPALSKGTIVICSRYFYSTLIYQGIVRKVAETSFLEQLNLFSVDDVLPDIVFYLDVNPKSGLINARNNSRIESYEGGDRIEREGVDFQRKVRDGYFRLTERYKDLFIVIKDGKNIEEISRTIYKHAKRRLSDDRT